jgi:D-threonate/D-erythronate kinase
MIVVIADDITGAAEMAGIGLRYNLRVVISDDVAVKPDPDLLVIYTNTRSMSKGAAVEVMEEITKKVGKIQHGLFYKKTDSVLRGHVLAELKTHMKALGLKRALLVPVNPSLDRTIKGGYYYVQGQLIHQTGFAMDPEFPVRSSHIAQMLGSEEGPVHVLEAGSSLPESDICIGEAQSTEDVAEWARYRVEPILFAGGASFFAALLDTMYPSGIAKGGVRVQLFPPLLFVSGTMFQKNVKRLKEHGGLVSYMPAAVYTKTLPDTSEFKQWRCDVINHLSSRGQAIIAIGEQPGEKADPNSLREKTGDVVGQVLKQVAVRELLIEGGSTAYSIIQKLGWHSFIPTEEMVQGIVRMRVDGTDDIHLTIKPGSYEWPVEWNFGK